MATPIDSLEVQIQSSVKNANDDLDALIERLNKVSKSLSGMNKGANKGAGIGNIGTGAYRASNSLGKLRNGFKSLIPGMNKANKSAKGFVSTIGLFYAKFFLAIRAFKGIGASINSAQDYIEEFNYFNVALNKVGQDSAKQFKKAGYDSAEAYAESFKTRFQTLQKQMTGYDVGKDGSLSFAGVNNLGLNITEVMKYQAAISQVTNSAGMLGEATINTAKALSMLSADWSSLTNQDLSSVQNNLQSALIGNSRAVYRYGIDVTKAGLAQVAMNHGVQQSVSSMSQSAKMQLRVLAILEQSKVAYGDIGRTINQNANQYRMLKNNLADVSRSFGALFMPVLEKVYPYLNAMVIVLKEFLQYLGKLAGIDFSSSMDLPKYKDSAKNAKSVEDSTKKTAKNTKKISDNLQSFDIINKLDDNQSSDSGGSGSGSPGDIDLSDDIADALKNYEKIWNKALNSTQNKAVQLARNIKKALIDGWKSGDFTRLGVRVGNWISRGLDSIKWKKLQKTVGKISKSIATYLNGFISGTDWNLVGRTIAEGLNSALIFSYKFMSKFDFLLFGKNIAKGLNSVISSFKWKTLGNNLGAKLRGVIQFAFGFVTTFDFANLGVKIGNSINAFFNKMGKVDERTGLNGWQELGVSITKSLSGIVTTITTALDKVDWIKVGEAIGQFLGKIDWEKILKKVGSLIASSTMAMIKAAFGAIAGDPIGVGNALSMTMLGWFAVNKLKGLQSGLASSLGTVLKGSVSDAATKQSGAIGKILNKKISASKIGTIGLALTFAVKSFEWTKSVYKEIFNKYSVNEIQEGFKEMFKEVLGDGAVANTLADLFTNLGLAFTREYTATEWADAIKKTFDNVKKNIKHALGLTHEGKSGEDHAGSSGSFGTSASVKVKVDQKSLGETKKLLGGIKSTAKVETKVFISKQSKEAWNKAMKKAGESGGAMSKLINGTGMNPLTKLINSLPTYQTGGFPEDGLFMANHNEVVGRFSNGKTAVANNEQITQGIANAVYPAVYSAITNAFNNGGIGGGNFNFYLDGKEMTNTVVKEINNQTRSRGRNPILGYN